MLTTILIGSSTTRFVDTTTRRVYTPRGYDADKAS
jgi:precorrin-3B methylase